MIIKSIARSVPDNIVTNDDILDIIRNSSRKNLSERQLKQVCSIIRNMLASAGSKYRRWRKEGDDARQYVINAASMALKQASLDAKDVDLLLYVGVGRGTIEPAMSTIFQNELEMTNATCFDILDACLSWLRAINVGYHYIRDGVYKNVMIINAEFSMFEYTDFSMESVDEVDYKFAQCTLGEAATATIVSEGKNYIDPFFYFKTDATKNNLCRIPLANIRQFSNKEICPIIKPLRFFAYSSEMFDIAKDMVIPICRTSKELNDRKTDLWFGHSASKTLTDYVAKEIGADDKFVNIFEEYGNTVSASVPLAISWAVDERILTRGMDIAIVVASAGFSTGIAHIPY